MAVSAVMLAHQVAGKAVRDALFLASLPVTDLPRMVMVAAVLSVLAVPVYSHLMAWAGPRRIVPLGFAVSAAAHVAEWMWLDAGAITAVVVYVHVAAFGALLLSGFWSLTSELFDPHTAREQFVRIASAGTFGGIVGGVTVERIAAWGPAEAALLLLAGLHAACAIGLGALGSSIPERGRSAPSPEPVFGWQIFRTSPHLRDIALLVVLGTASAAIVDYLLKSKAAAEYSGAELLQFFALFYTIVQVVTFAFQAVVATPLQRQLGVGRSVTMLPAGLGLGAAISILFPTISSVALARGTESVLRGSVFRNGYELLFSAMSPAEKRRVKAFLDVSCDRAGDALGAGIVQLLLLAGPAFVVNELLAVVLLMVAGSIWLGERLQAMYLRGTEPRLVDHAAANGFLTVTEMGGPTLLTLDVPVVDPPVALEDVRPGPREHVPVQVLLDEPLDLLRQLRSGNRAHVLAALESAAHFEAMHIAQVLELLAWDDVTSHVRRALERTADRHVGLLVDALLDGGTEFAIRRRIPRVLVSVPTQRALDGLILGLSDPRFEVRYQCSRAMDRMLVAEPMLQVDSLRIYQVVERELSVARPVWNGHRLLDQFESADAVMFLDEQLRERANRSLEHVFSLLVTVLPREPLKIAFRGMHSDDPMLRGLALEYLTGVLPEGVRLRLWDILEPGNTHAREPRPTAEALADLLRSQDLPRTATFVTPSADDAPGQSDLPPSATPPTNRR